MLGYIKGQVDYLYFIYGLAYTALATLCFILRGKEEGKLLPWSWFGTFAVFGALTQWLTLFAYALADSQMFAITRAALMAISILALLEFGRSGSRRFLSWVPGRWLTAAFGICGALVLIFYRFPYAGLVVRLIILGAGVTAFTAMYNAAKRTDSFMRTLLLAGCALIGLYAVDISTYPQIAVIPSFVVSDGSIYGPIAFAALLPIAVSSIVVTIPIWTYSKQVQELGSGGNAHPYEVSLWTICLVFVVLILGWVATEITGRLVDAEARQALVSRTLTALPAIDPEDVKKLTGTVEDFGKEHFDRIREKLAEVRRANSDTRFVYLMGLRESNVVFLADAEPMLSKWYSPPGQVYPQATPELKALFSGGEPYVEGPMKDNWGVWVSGLAPLKDPSSGIPVAVLGMDIDARTWHSKVSHYRLLSIFMTFIFSAFTVAFIMAWQKAKESTAKSAALKIASLKVANEKKLSDITSSLGEGLYVLDEHGIVTFMNPEAERLLGWKTDEVIGKRDHETFHYQKEDGSLYPASECPVHRVLASGKPFRLERDVFTRKDGGVFPVTYVSSPIREGDKVVGVVTAFHDITAQVEMERALKDSEERYRKLVELSPDGILVQIDGKIIFANASCARILGVENSAELIGESIFEFLPPDYHDAVRKRAKDLLESGIIAPPNEEKIVRSDGSVLDVEVTAIPITYENELATQVIIRDITERKKAERELEFESLLLDNAMDSVIVHDLEGRIIYANKAAYETRGYRRKELLKMLLQDIIHPSAVKDLQRHKEIVMKTGIAVYESRHLAKDGTAITVEVNAKLVELDDRKVVINIVRDISERKQAEEAIKQMAYYDLLTDLPNRTLFNDRLSIALAHAHRNREKLSLVFLDLDNFKAVNDTLGYVAGDQLLRLVARRLLSLVREGDTVARLGGDEFVLLLPKVNREEDAIRVAEKILEAFKEPFGVNGNKLYLTPSIGIALYPSDGEDAEALLRNADTAMYRAKEKGRNNYQLYAPAMSAAVFERLALESGMRHGLENGEFTVYYQPLIGIESGEIVGVEGLARWEHPELGLILPLEFIPLAEETGLIVPMGELILKTACKQNKVWQDAGFPPMRVAVNLSAKQFQQPDLIEMIERSLEETGLDPRHLEIEITESVAMRNAKRTIETLKGLKKMGIRIAIDDFGTGYSSLSYLKRFPIDALKIDRVFIKDVSMNSDSEAIVEMIIVLAKNLKLSVVAEGVETEEQLAFLKERGCDVAQGYLISRPSTAEEMTRLLESRFSPMLKKT